MILPTYVHSSVVISHIFLLQIVGTNEVNSGFLDALNETSEGSEEGNSSTCSSSMSLISIRCTTHYTANSACASNSNSSLSSTNSARSSSSIAISDSGGEYSKQPLTKKKKDEAALSHICTLLKGSYQTSALW